MKFFIPFIIMLKQSIDHINNQTDKIQNLCDPISMELEQAIFKLD